MTTVTCIYNKGCPELVVDKEYKFVGYNRGLDCAIVMDEHGNKIKHYRHCFIGLPDLPKPPHNMDKEQIIAELNKLYAVYTDLEKTSAINAKNHEYDRANKPFYVGEMTAYCNTKIKLTNLIKRIENEG